MRKEELKIDDIVAVMESYIGWGRIVKARVKAIYPKKGYNMYLCETLKQHTNLCITDKDLYIFKTAKRIGR